MSFFESFFRKQKRSESVLLIDIGAEEMTGAYVRYEEEQSSKLIYTRSLPIEIRKDEEHARAMLRALDVLGKDLIREGAPALMRATGSGTTDIILVSVDAPWQETTVRTEEFESAEPFIFTKNLVSKKLEETIAATPEKMIADESIIGTILNGYETHNPYGKKVTRASIIILTSFIEQSTANGIIGTLRGLFHTTAILPITGSSLRYQAMRDVFPHERDAIILDATSESLTSIALIRRGIFVMLTHIAHATTRENWVEAITGELTLIAKSYPLPRNIFLLARESETATLRGLLDAANFGSLWLSDNPPTIVSVLGSQVDESIQKAADSPADTALLLMIRYYESRRNAKEDVA